ncbi:MAG: ComF family protein [Bradymonadia bacterium]
MEHPLATLMTTLWPGQCLHCASPLGWGPLCTLCHRLMPSRPLEPVSSSGDLTWSTGAYEGALRSLIRRLKYDQRIGGWGMLMKRMVEEIPEGLRLDPPDRVVGIPGHRQRVKRRGFDLTAGLTSKVARTLGVPQGQLKRVRQTSPQAACDFARRLTNVEGAFDATARLEGADVLLVDDVTTTGATLTAATKALRSRGVVRIRCMVLAHAPKNVT